MPLYLGMTSKETYRYLRCFEDEFWHMPWREFFPDRCLYFSHQVARELLAMLHQQEEHNPLILILGPPLAYTNTVRYPVHEVVFDHRVYLGTSKPNATGVKNFGRSAGEQDGTKTNSTRLNPWVFGGHRAPRLGTRLGQRPTALLWY